MERTREEDGELAGTWADARRRGSAGQSHRCLSKLGRALAFSYVRAVFSRWRDSAAFFSRKAFPYGVVRSAERLVLQLRGLSMRWLLCCAWATLLGSVAVGREFTVLVYNVDNLVNADGKTESDDYRPARYSRAHLLKKLNNIVRIAAQYDEGYGPDIILFQEVERDFASDQYLFDHEGMLQRFANVRIEDMLGERFDKDVAALPVEALLLKAFNDRGLIGYQVAAADDAAEAKDRRRVAHLNVVFTRFPIGAVHTYMVPNAPAVLEVQVEVDRHPLYLFNNDWRAGATSEEAEKTRILAAETIRERLNEILSVNANADVIVAGDFNSFCDQKDRFRWRRTALHDVLRVQTDERSLRNPAFALYNLWYELPTAQRGSELYHGRWATFMHMLLSRGLYDYRGVQYIDNSFQVGAFAGLNVTPEGEPYRWSFKGFGHGFSEHFPISARFTTVRNNRVDIYLNVSPTQRTSKEQ